VSRSLRSIRAHALVDDWRVAVRAMRWQMREVGQLARRPMWSGYDRAMTPFLGWRWPARSLVILVTLAAMGCATPAVTAVTETATCAASSVRATLDAPGTFSADSATGVMLYATEAVRLATTSGTSCYLERPTVVQVSLPSRPEDVGSLTGVPSRVDLRPARPVTLEFGSPVGCSHFSPPVWASSVTVTFPGGPTFRLGGMHMDVSCGTPLLLRF
jgi:hypothetical protein